MDARASIAEYAKRLVSGPGVKALLLDEETSRILSVVTSQSWLLEQDVVLIELLSKGSDPLPDLSAVVFLRPTPENVLALRKELRAPRFSSYRLVFSNVLRRTLVEELADADEHERVSEVLELYADFFAPGRNLVSLGVTPCLDALRDASGALHNPHFERTVDGITGLLLALKRRPVVRFLGASALCRNLAERVSVRMDQEAALFSFAARNPAPLLLILDRREDPVTPLLNEWTYEAMTHELIGIVDNRVDLRDCPNVPKEFRQLVLDPNGDEFYAANQYRNFGQLGDSLKTLVDAFQKRSKMERKMDSIQDMISFVAAFPEFRRESAHVSRHVTLAGELSRRVGRDNLLEVSQLEQDLACRQAEAEHIREIAALLRSSKVPASDKLRVVMLYALRYEDAGHRGLGQMRDALHRAGIPPAGVALVDAVKSYAGSQRRAGDVFSNKSFFAKASSSVRRGLGGIDNVYTQHEPQLVETMDNLFRGRLRDDEYPAAGAGVENGGAQGGFLGSSGTAPGIAFVAPPREVIVVIAGGATYEEAKCISAMNSGKYAFVPQEGSATATATAIARQLKASIVLCGSEIHNSQSFATEISRNAALVKPEDKDHMF